MMGTAMPTPPRISQVVQGFRKPILRIADCRFRFGRQDRITQHDLTGQHGRAGPLDLEHQFLRFGHGLTNAHGSGPGGHSTNYDSTGFWVAAPGGTTYPRKGQKSARRVRWEEIQTALTANTEQLTLAI